MLTTSSRWSTDVGGRTRITSNNPTHASGNAMPRLAWSRARIGLVATAVAMKITSRRCVLRFGSQLPAHFVHIRQNLRDGGVEVLGDLLADFAELEEPTRQRRALEDRDAVGDR